MGIIKAAKLAFDYFRYDDDGKVEETNRAIDEVSLDIEAGQFIAILGHNGSGKSTLAKHINALLIPSEGTLWMDNMDTAAEENLWKIRQRAGMVFQNPDNQIIGTVVEEDVGFGPENLGIPTDEIWKRVEASLSAVGMLSYRNQSPNKLSGGQKQRVAIAGVVAMRPRCIVLDEPTAMLDPSGRKEVLAVVHELNKQEGVTVILITHYMEEVVPADKVFVMDSGKIVMQGTPREIFAQVDRLQSFRLDVPQVTLLAHELKKNGLSLPAGVLTIDELVDEICRQPHPVSEKNYSRADKNKKIEKQEKVLLELQNATYTYSPGTVYEMHAVKNVNLKIREGQFIGIIGHTGSGKSTLIQHFNGLIKPTAGVVRYEGENIRQERYDMKRLRSNVGLVFQYPEHQLFEETVLADVCFGPKNQGLSKEEAKARAAKALQQVGMDEKYYGKSPFELSGGQKRRVAIAGVLAMNPKVLILDEPTAGLDPKGRDDILDQIAYLHDARNITILLVSHSMEDIAKYVQRIIVMNRGEVAFDDTPREVFSHFRELEEMNLAAPQITYIIQALAARGLAAAQDATTVEEANSAILNALGMKKS